MKKKGLFVGLIIILAFVGVSVYAQGEGGSSTGSGEGVTSVGGFDPDETEEVWTVELWEGERSGMDEILGIVRDGMFYPVSDSEGGFSSFSLRLTGIQMQEAIAPEAEEIYVDEFEGRAIMIEGLDGGSWIYDVIIIDKAGPILSEVVKKVFTGGGWLDG